MAGAGRIPRILLVEDSEDDAFFFRRVARRSGVQLEICHLSNGLAAVAELERFLSAPTNTEVTAPDLVFLDLKLPDLDGFELLSWVKKQPSLARLNIAVLSGSEDAADLHRAKSLGAISYFAKPIKVEQLRSILTACGLHRESNGSPVRSTVASA